MTLVSQSSWAGLVVIVALLAGCGPAEPAALGLAGIEEADFPMDEEIDAPPDEMSLSRTPAPPGCTASGTRLNCRHARLAGYDFSGANYRFAQFDGADLTGARFDRASFIAGMFTNAILRDASFVGADLTRAAFRGSAVARADFSGANLTDAWFQGANASSANFTGATVTSASFANTDLSLATWTDGRRCRSDPARVGVCLPVN